jgi:predicted DNA-binding protein with PD1-like motif
VLLLSVASGEEVLETITRKAAEAGITDGAIVSLIGAVEACAVSTMAAADPAKDIVTEYAQPLELSGTGEITDGQVHIHVVLGAEGNQAITGHLHRATVTTFFVNAYVVPMS